MFRGIGTAQKSLIYCKSVATATKEKRDCQRRLACVSPDPRRAKLKQESWNLLRENSEAFRAHKDVDLWTESGILQV